MAIGISEGIRESTIIGSVSGYRDDANTKCEYVYYNKNPLYFTIQKEKERKR